MTLQTTTAAQLTAPIHVCDNCELPTDNTPEHGDVLCENCSPDAVHASEAAEVAAIDDAEHARIQRERDAEDGAMTAAINADVTRRGPSRPGVSISFMRVRA